MDQPEHLMPDLDDTIDQDGAIGLDDPALRWEPDGDDADGLDADIDLDLDPSLEMEPGQDSDLDQDWAASPDLDDALSARSAGDAAGALAAFDRVLATSPLDGQALAGRAWALRMLGQPRTALAPLLKLLSHDIGNLDARLDLAQTLREAGLEDQARDLYALLLRDPAVTSPAAWRDLALMLLDESRQIPARAKTAETCLERAQALDPTDLKVRHLLAELAASQQNFDHAGEMYHDILAISPQSAAAHAGLGQILASQARLDEALDRLDQALVIEENNAVAHLGRARVHLLWGDDALARDDLDWRWSLPGNSRPTPPGAPWDGHIPVQGKTILLWSEPGDGAVIHLMRHVPVLAGLGARVILGLPPLLVSLAHGLDGVDDVLLSGQPLPEDVTIDLNAALADLPWLLADAEAPAPTLPYLSAIPARRRPIIAPDSAPLKVGLVWAGPRTAWSVPFQALMPLLGHAGMSVFSLQTGPAANDPHQMAHPSLISDLSATMTDFADLAARIAELDLLITVDGPAAHLAGAMGVPAWVMLSQAPDWHWGAEGDTTPRYPSLRLFRRPLGGDWDQVVHDMILALDQVMAPDDSDDAPLTETVAPPPPTLAARLAARLEPGDLVVLVDADTLPGLPSSPDAPIRVLSLDSRTLGDRDGPALALASGHSAMLPGWTTPPAALQRLDTLIADHPETARLILRLGTHLAARRALAGLSRQPDMILADAGLPADLADDQAASGLTLTHSGPALLAWDGDDDDDDSGKTRDGSAVGKTSDGSAVGTAPVVDTQPPGQAAPRQQAQTLAANGSQLLQKGQVNPAGDLFAQALALDPSNVEANVNLAGLLRRIGRSHAAIACWQRALANGAGVAVRANLANALREQGQVQAARHQFDLALAEQPDNPRILLGLGLLECAEGRAGHGLALFDRANDLSPGTVPAAARAQALMKSGELARGLALLSSGDAPAQDGPPAWRGEPLEARTILIRADGPARQIIHLARFIPHVARQGGLVTVECATDLVRILSTLDGVDHVCATGTAQDTDLAINLHDTPRLLSSTCRPMPPRDVPYLHQPGDIMPPPAHPAGLRVGIVWGDDGIPTVPLSALLSLARQPGITLISLQTGPLADELAQLGALPLVENTGAHCGDLADVAAAIAGTDLVVGTDCAATHLAAAMGHPTWIMLPVQGGWGWQDGADSSPCYPTLRLFRQTTDRGWTQALGRMGTALSSLLIGKSLRGKANTKSR